jgi:hypothetical protein
MKLATTDSFIAPADSFIWSSSCCDIALSTVSPTTLRAVCLAFVFCTSLCWAGSISDQMIKLPCVTNEMAPLGLKYKVTADACYTWKQNKVDDRRKIVDLAPVPDSRCPLGKSKTVEIQSRSLESCADINMVNDWVSAEEDPSIKVQVRARAPRFELFHTLPRHAL